MKKAKKKRHQMPRLSILDQIIYWAIFAVLCLVWFALIFAFLILRQKIAFSDASVLAAAEHSSSLWSLVPMLTFQILSLVLWLIPYEAQRPIFGLKNFKYGPPAWPKVYPIFMKNKPPVWVSPRKKRERKQLAAFLALLLLVSFIPFPWALYGRDCLYADGNIRQYSMFNHPVQEYLPQELAEAEFSVYHYSTGRYGTGTHWDVRMRLTTGAGNTYTFEGRDFRPGESWPDAMLRLKEHYDPAIFRADPEHLQKVILDQNLSQKEILLLNRLFGPEQPGR